MNTGSEFSATLDMPDGCDLRTVGRFMLDLDAALKSTYEALPSLRGKRKKKTGPVFEIAEAIISNDRKQIILTVRVVA